MLIILKDKFKDWAFRLKALPPAKKKRIKIFFLIFSALFTGFLYLLYYLYLFYNLKSKGELTYPLAYPLFVDNSGEIKLFLIRIREMIDGYWNNSDPGFFENRNSPAHIYEPLLPGVYYFISLFTGFKYIVAIGDFLTIAGIFILIFLLVYLLTQRYYISLFFTFMFLMVKNFLSLLFPDYLPISKINQFKDLAKAFTPFILSDWHTPDRLNFLVYASTRPGYLFFVPALIFLFLFIKKGKNLYVVPLGVFYGLLFYVYPFYWIYMTIVFGLLGAAYLFKKNFIQFKRLIFSGAIAWLMSIFYWFHHFELRSLPNFQELEISSFGIEYGHNFRFEYWFWYLFYALIAAVIYFYAKKKNKIYFAYYFIPLLIAGFIGFNMQVITGINFMSKNWHIRVMFFPIFLISTVLFTWFLENLEGKNKLIKKCVIALMIILVIFQVTGSVQGQMMLEKKLEKLNILPRGVAESFLWIDKNLPKDSVFLTPNPETNYHLQIYTPGRTFIQYEYIAIASHKEITERLYIVYSFFRIAPEVFEKKFGYDGDSGNSLCHLYGEFFARPGTNPQKQDLMSGYKNYKLDLAQVLTKYKIDYIYYEPADKELTDVNFDEFDYLEKIYNNGGVAIYKLIPVPEKINSKTESR